VSEIIGKPIVSAETGDRLGSVSDALVEDGGVKVVALVIRSGMLAKDRVLPFRDIQTLGGDTVLARTDSGVRGPRDWHRAGVKAMRTSELTGKPVVTAGGQCPSTKKMIGEKGWRCPLARRADSSVSTASCGTHRRCAPNKRFARETPSGYARFAASN
jgi:sporulation protein YlmC with PRC-barrel domain